MPPKLYPPARQALKEIYQYTARTWGHAQADAYINGLYDAVQQLAENKSRWRPVPHPRAKTVFFTRYQHHYIFFRQLSNPQIGIISILHENQDIPNRLKNDMDNQ